MGERATVIALRRPGVSTRLPAYPVRFRGARQPISTAARRDRGCGRDTSAFGGLFEEAQNGDDEGAGPEGESERPLEQAVVCFGDVGPDAVLRRQGGDGLGEVVLRDQVGQGRVEVGAGQGVGVLPGDRGGRRFPASRRGWMRFWWSARTRALSRLYCSADSPRSREIAAFMAASIVKDCTAWAEVKPSCAPRTRGAPSAISSPRRTASR